jgi:hypothetical protein
MIEQILLNNNKRCYSNFSPTFREGNTPYVYCCIRECMHHDKDLSSPAAVRLFVEPSIIITTSSPVLRLTLYFFYIYLFIFLKRKLIYLYKDKTQGLLR